MNGKRVGSPFGFDPIKVEAPARPAPDAPEITVGAVLTTKRGTKLTVTAIDTATRRVTVASGRHSSEVALDELLDELRR